MSASVAVLCRQLLGAQGAALSISVLAERTHDNASEIGSMLLRMRDSGVVKMIDEGWIIKDETRARALANNRPLEADGMRVSHLCKHCGASSSFMVTWRHEQ